MICKAKTLSSAGGAYEAPTCRVYSVTVESVIAQSPGNNPNNHTEYLTGDADSDYEEL